MRWRFSLAVWGDWHIGQFLAHGLPSMKAAGNLEAIDHLIAVHTRASDAERLDAALRGVNVEIRAEIAEDAGSHQAEANGIIHSHALEDFRVAAQAGDVWALLAPDMVWSAGTFALYKGLLDGGRKIIFRPLLRVDADKTGTIRDFSNRHLARLALECEHDVGKLYHADAEHFTSHPEAIVWPAPDGRLHQTVSADIVLCAASQIAVTRQILAADPFDGDRMAAIADSDESVALAMCAAANPYAWQNGNGRLSPDNVRNFTLTYQSPASRGLMRRPYRLHSGDTDPATWAEAEQMAADFAAKVFP